MCGRDRGLGVRRRSVRGYVGEEVFKMFKENENEDRKIYAGA